MAVIIRTTAIVGGAGLPGLGLTSLYWAPGTLGGSTADATDCLARFRTMWNTFVVRISSTINIDFDPIVLAIEATTGTLTGTFVGTDPLTVTGTGSGDVAPKQTQGLLRFSTGTVLNGRRVRGRLFVPGVTETDNSIIGVPAAGYVTDVTAGGATLFTPGATASLPVVWHRPGPAGAGASPAITGASCAPTWSVLRSRRA